MKTDANEKINKLLKQNKQNIETIGLWLSITIACFIMCAAFAAAPFIAEGGYLDYPDPPPSPLGAVFVVAISSLVSAVPIAGFACLLKKKKILSVVLLSISALFWTVLIIFFVCIGAFTDEPHIFVPFAMLIIPLIICCVLGIVHMAKTSKNKKTYDMLPGE